VTAFLALLRRDLLVARRNAGPLLTATLTQPILVILVFGNLLPRMDLVAADFGTVMLPGLMAITMMMAGAQGVLMPLVKDLSGSREVDERLLAPIGVRGVAFERITAGSMQVEQQTGFGKVRLFRVCALAGEDGKQRFDGLLPELREQLLETGDRLHGAFAALPGVVDVGQ